MAGDADVQRDRGTGASNQVVVLAGANCATGAPISPFVEYIASALFEDRVAHVKGRRYLRDAVVVDLSAERARRARKGGAS